MLLRQCGTGSYVPAIITAADHPFPVRHRAADRAGEHHGVIEMPSAIPRIFEVGGSLEHRPESVRDAEHDGLGADDHVTVHGLAQRRSSSRNLERLVPQSLLRQAGRKVIGDHDVNLLLVPPPRTNRCIGPSPIGSQSTYPSCSSLRVPGRTTRRRFRCVEPYPHHA